MSPTCLDLEPRLIPTRGNMRSYSARLAYGQSSLVRCRRLNKGETSALLRHGLAG